MAFLEDIKQRAKKDIKTIVLPEAMDSRILKATQIIISEKIANIVLLGNIDQIKDKANKENINIEGATIIDCTKSDKLEEYAQILSETDKTITYEEAMELVKNPVYYGMIMAKAGDSDGYVSGAMNTTKNILKTAMRIFKKEGTKILSTALLMLVPDCEYRSKDGVYIFSDCALNENPGYLALSEIAISSAKTYEKFTNKQAKVAMLSYSTFGSAKSEYTEKVIKATQRVNKKWPELLVDGEIQLDAAIVPKISYSKAPNSKIKGEANVLIFPDINSGNIGCKLVERLGNAQMFGPICQGLEKPINDLSRGCSVERYSWNNYYDSSSSTKIKYLGESSYGIKQRKFKKNNWNSFFWYCIIFYFTKYSRINKCN